MKDAAMMLAQQHAAAGFSVGEHETTANKVKGWRLKDTIEETHPFHALIHSLSKSHSRIYIKESCSW